MKPEPRIIASDLPGEVLRVARRLARHPDAEQVVLLPDAHLGGSVCNGLVLATRTSLLPEAVGQDIGCGYATLPLTTRHADWTARPLRERLLRAWEAEVPVRLRPRRLAPPVALEGLSSQTVRGQLADVSRLQCGTLGGGNHFLELQQDEQGQAWLLVHSGSRGAGPLISGHHLAQATATGGWATLEVETEAGQAFLQDQAWARAYAGASRRRMLADAVEACRRLVDCRPDWDRLLESDHNHVQPETHAGQALWVHRKSANQLAKDAVNVIPGSMGTFSCHVRGRDTRVTLASCAHGAGRQLRRGTARRQIRREQLARALTGVVYRPRASLVEEAPAAYRDLQQVLRLQRKLLGRVRRLVPLVVHKAP